MNSVQAGDVVVVARRQRLMDAWAWAYAGPPSDRVVPVTIVFEEPKK